jgi:hypothetical protein
MSTVMTIENFDTPLRNSKILQYTLKNSQQTPLYEIAAAGSENFARSILVAPSRAVGAQQFFRTAWDAVFQIQPVTANSSVTQQQLQSQFGTYSSNNIVGGIQQQQQDWSFILTYISNSPKPSCIFIEDGIDPPEAFIKRLPQHVTLIVQKSLGLRPSQQFDTIFFPPITEPSSQEANYVLGTLDILLQNKNDERRSWLKELRVAGAGLVWTRVAESQSHGAVYWYDPHDSEVRINKLPPSIVAEHLKVIASLLQ